MVNRFAPQLFRFVAALSVAWSAIVSAENWPRFRGPTGQGLSTETGLPLQWSDAENIAWKTEIPGLGWSSPVVHGDHIFVTSTNDDGDSCYVICVDRVTGNFLWNKRVFQQDVRHKRGDNSHATPTPVTDGSMVYAVFSAGGIAALDYDGEIQWTNHDVHFFSQHGLGASPILYNDLLIMSFDGSSDGDDNLVGFKKPWDGAVLLALDKRTGDVRWRGARGKSRLAHVTPSITDYNGAQQIISAAGDVIQGHDPNTGELIWTVYSQGEGVAPSVVSSDDLVFSCSGFEEPTIRTVRLGGEGTVTDSHIAWEAKQGVPSLASLLYVDPHVYSVTDKGIATCFDAKSGDMVWQQRIGGKHSASPIYADGRIYYLEEHTGESVVIEPGDTYKEVARNRLGEVCKGSIAVSQGNLFIRSENNLFCIGDPPENR